MAEENKCRNKPDMAEVERAERAVVVREVAGTAEAEAAAAARERAVVARVAAVEREVAATGAVEVALVAAEWKDQGRVEAGCHLDRLQVCSSHLQQRVLPARQA